MIGAQEINMNYCELSLYIFFTIVIFNFFILHVYFVNYY